LYLSCRQRGGGQDPNNTTAKYSGSLYDTVHKKERKSKRRTLSVVFVLSLPRGGWLMCRETFSVYLVCLESTPEPVFVNV
jgi:hypothetical protein